jgi:hypothetical protein
MLVVIAALLSLVFALGAALLTYASAGGMYRAAAVGAGTFVTAMMLCLVVLGLLLE